MECGVCASTRRGTCANQKSKHISKSKCRTFPLLSRVGHSRYKANQSEDTPSEEDTNSLGSAGMSTPKKELSEKSFSENISDDLKKSKESFEETSISEGRSRTQTGDSLEGLDIPGRRDEKISPPTSLPINSSLSGLRVTCSRPDEDEDDIFNERRSSVKSDSALQSRLTEQESRQWGNSASSSISGHSISQPDLGKAQQSPIFAHSNGDSNTSESPAEFSPENVGIRSSKGSVKSDDYIIISDKDLMAYEEEEEKKKRETVSAAHRNKLKPG